MKQKIYRFCGLLIFSIGDQINIVNFFHKIINEKSKEYIDPDEYHSFGEKLVERLKREIKDKHKRISHEKLIEQVHAHPEYIDWRGRNISGGLDMTYLKKHDEPATMRQAFAHSLTDEEAKSIKKAKTVKEIFEILGFEVAEIVTTESITLTLTLDKNHVPYRRDQNIWAQFAQYTHGSSFVWNWNDVKIFHSKIQEGKFSEDQCWPNDVHELFFENLFEKIKALIKSFKEIWDSLTPRDVLSEFNNLVYS